MEILEKQQRNMSNKRRKEIYAYALFRTVSKCTSISVLL